MKILDTKLKDLKGVVIKNGDVDLTVREVCLLALLNVKENIDTLKSYKLAKKVDEAKEELTSEEIVYVKDLVARSSDFWTLPVLVIGATLEILN